MLKQKGFAHLILIIGLLVIGAVAVFVVYPMLKGSTPEIAKELSLALNSPTDGQALSDNKLAVSGKTLPNTIVVFFTETDEGSLESDASGNFEGSVMLASGINTLVVTAFGENGDEKTLTMDVLYDPEL